GQPTDAPAPGATLTSGAPSAQPATSGAKPGRTAATATPAAAAASAPGAPTQQLSAAGPDASAGAAPTGRIRQDRTDTDTDANATPTATGPDAYAATTAPTPTSTVAPTETPGAGAPATPATHATQLAERLAPLQKGPDGVHRLTIHLNPVDLGPISVTAEVRTGDIHVHLAGATDAAREALRAALPELRKELQGSGFGSSSLDVSHDAPGRGTPDQGGAPGRQAREHQPGPRTDPGREERTERHRDSTGERAPRPGRPGLDLHV
ncbi:MAG: Collagen alpha-2(I) chain, partial [Dactylosporangium sp.]|nr:Collagen alpha-2(I) chain [Dactylosporangium sp.]